MTAAAVARVEARFDTKSDEEIRPANVPIVIEAHDLPAIVAALSVGSTTGSGNDRMDGPGSGSGPGDGRGSGPGQYDGGGGGPYQIGGAIVGPRLISETKPAYTANAMRARIQGSVWLQAVVLPDGSVGAARVVRSLDATFGLDDEAVRTVKMWRFAPATLAGRAIPIRIDIELAFSLR